MTGSWTAPDAPTVLHDEALRSALRALLLAMADDDLVAGHRHSEWTGFAPDIESDVALSSIAQDELGHARLLYEQVGALDGVSADRLAFGRPAGDFRNAVLVERDNGDWAHTIVRAWLYDHADAVRLAALAASPLGSFAALAKTVQREEKYHLVFSDAWLARLTAASEDSRSRIQRSLGEVWPDAIDFFEATPGVETLVAAGALTGGDTLSEAWHRMVTERLDVLRLTVPDAAPRPAGGGGRAGTHTPALAALLDEMTSVWRTDPEARW
jgi:ring-1,2-phenylacetyl-CoA epoxidase subunit PaaC